MILYGWWREGRRVLSRLGGLLTVIGVILVVQFLSSCGCAGVKCAQLEAAPPQDEFKPARFESNGQAKGYPSFVSRTGGKPVLLLHELPGLTPGALNFARVLEDRGWKVYTPQLFGSYGQNSGWRGLIQTWGSGRFQTLSCSDVGSIRDDVDNMLDQIAAHHPGEPITIIGNCLTGSVPFDLIHRPDVETVILCQPAMPFKIPGLGRGVDVWPMTDDRFAASVAAMRNDERKRVILVQYAQDRIANIKRSAGLVERLVGEGRGGQVEVIVAGASEEEGKRVFGGSAAHVGMQAFAVADPKGHSTLTGAGCADRDKFHTRLWRLIGRGSP